MRNVFAWLALATWPAWGAAQSNPVALGAALHRLPAAKIKIPNRANRLLRTHLPSFSPYFFAACTVSSSANFHTACSDGDTITINNSVTLTCEAAGTCIAGNSPTDDTGTPAIQCASASGTGIFNIAAGATFVWRGPIRQCNANWTAGAGSTITYDATAAATPSTAKYSWQVGLANATTAHLALVGTSGARITVNNASTDPTGGFGCQGTIWTGCGSMQLAFNDWSYVGAPDGHDNTDSAVFSSLNAGTTTLAIADSNFDHCAQIKTNAVSGPNTVTVDRVKITNSLVTSNSFFGFHLLGQVAKTSGTRRVTNLSVHGSVAIIGTAGQSTGYELHDIVFKRLYSSTAQTWTNTAGAGMDQYDDIMYFVNTETIGADPVVLPSGGNLNRLYNYRQTSFNVTNPHLFGGGGARAGNQVINGLIVESTSKDATGDSLQFGSSDAVSPGATITVLNLLHLPNSIGAAETVVNIDGGSMPNTQVIAKHVTLPATTDGTGNTQVYGMGAETALTVSAGNFSGPTCWLGWRSTSGQAAIAAYHSGTATVSDGAYVGADYNAVFNFNATPYRPADAKFATPSPPGAHDWTFSRVPQFGDNTRRIMMFDQQYLGVAQSSTVWDSSTAYLYNDVLVTPVHATYFGGIRINWRCILESGCPAGVNNEPGVGSAYSQYWEPNSLHYIFDDNALGTLHYDLGLSGVSIVRIAYEWVAKGWTIQETSLGGACPSTGLDIGANPRPPIRWMPPTALVM